MLSSSSTFSTFTSSLSTRFSTYVAASTFPPTLDPSSRSASGSDPSASFPNEPRLVWSAFDRTPVGDAQTTGGGSETRVLLKAYPRTLSIWSAPTSSSSPTTEIARISGEGLLEWGGALSEIVGAKILGGELKDEALRVVILLNTVDCSRIVVHSLETLEVMGSTSLAGQACELQASDSFIAVSTTNPSRIHILSSADFGRLTSVDDVSLNPSTGQPTFTLSSRFLAYASSKAPYKDMPLIVRLERSGLSEGKRREPTLSPGKVVGTLGGLVLGGGPKGKRRELGAGVEGTLVDVAGRFVSGGAAAGIEGMRRVGNLVAGFAATSPPPASTCDTLPSASSPSSSPPPHPSLPSITSPTYFPSRYPPPLPQDNSIAIVDLRSPRPNTPIIHFYLHPSSSPTREQVQHLSISPSGRHLFVAQSPSLEFNVLEIRPRGRGSSAAGGEARELYVLKRGVTPAVVDRVEWDESETAVGVLSGRGTIHMYLFNAQGGIPAGHLEGRACNLTTLPSLSFVVNSITKIRPQVDPKGHAACRDPLPRSSFLDSPHLVVASHQVPSTPIAFALLRSGDYTLSATPGLNAGLVPSNLPSASAHAAAKSVLIFDPERQGLRLHQTTLGLRSASSNIALMLNHPSSVAGAGKEVVAVENEVTLARWDLREGEREDGEVRLGKRAKPSSPRREDATSSRDRSASWLSNVEIETSSPSFRVLSGPIHLLHQFEFHIFDNSSLSDFTPRQADPLPSDRLVVRAEVQVSSSPSSPAQHPYHLGFSVPPASSSYTSSFSMDRFPSSSSARSFSSGGPASFDASLESALSTSLGPVPPQRSRPIAPSYPNGDGPTTAPRSWKAATVPVASLLGEGYDRLQKGVHHARRRSTSKTKPQHPSLSFEESTVFDEGDFASARSSGGGGGTVSLSSGPSSLSEETWEDDDDLEECRKVVEEQEEYEDLIVGDMEDLGPGGVVMKEGEGGGGEETVGRKKGRSASATTKRRGGGKAAGGSPSPLGSGGEERKHSQGG